MKNSYEAMFIVKPNLTKEETDSLSAHLKDGVTKNSGTLDEIIIWAEKRKLSYPINKFDEGIYYLVRFKTDSLSIIKMKEIYKLNDSIMRFLIIKIDEKQPQVTGAVLKEA
jgi:small subunit ribosomal protein S6